MAVEVLDPTNPQLNALLLDLRQRLRPVLVPGSYGDIVQVEPAPVHDGKLAKLKLGFVATLDLTIHRHSGRK